VVISLGIAYFLWITAGLVSFVSLLISAGLYLAGFWLVQSAVPSLSATRNRSNSYKSKNKESSMPELQLENVSYQYKHGDRKVVDDVTCRFEGGQLNAVVGPSGCGKTTLLSLLAGLDRPNQGQIYLDGESLADLDLDQYRRERVSMIFQAFHLFPLLTALENVCFPMQLNGLPKEEIPERGKALLASVGITEDKYQRYPANLSGGEQQRVAIARRFC
jgi:putative ABC transport system ATP-binding protein